jgi:hypothetical protein
MVQALRPIVVPRRQNSLQGRAAQVENVCMLRSRAPRTLRLGGLAVALVCLLALAGCTPEQTATYDRINRIRTEQGLPTLLPSPHAMAKAQAWAEHLAAVGHLEHSDLWDGMPEGGVALGENVGMGGDLDAISAAFMNSPKHRANLLDPRWNWVGTGVATGANGLLYVVQVFATY